jgi:exosortase C (VPDSG-CTERM-specific)
MNTSARRGEGPEHTAGLSSQEDLRAPQFRVWAYAGFVAVLAIAFCQPLYALAIHAGTSDIHSHVLLIPLISAYLIFLRRSELPRRYTSSLVPPLIAGSLGVWVAASSLLKASPPISHNDYLSLTTFSFLSLLVAGAFLFLGPKWVAAMTFPIAFLIFMVPLPDRLLHGLETASQLASTEAAAMFFNLTDIPILRTGAVFQLPGIAIQVAEECSGIRSSWILFITSIIASWLFLNSPWRRAILIAFVVPLAIIRNGLRIWVIGFLCVEFGPDMIHSIIHRHGGPFFFALSLVPFFLLLCWLRRGEQGKARNTEMLTAETLKLENADLLKH